MNRMKSRMIETMIERRPLSPASPAGLALGLCLLLAAGLMAGCTRDADVEPGVGGTGTPGEVEMASNGDSEERPGPSRDIPQALLDAPEVAAALEAAARDADVELDEVSLLDVNEVTWPDSGLGCGEPGVSYLQVLTPGYRVVAWADGRRVIYHTTRGAEALNVVPCDSARSKGMAVETLAGGMLGRIMDDLRGRVGDDVEILPLGLTLVPARTLTCDELQVGMPTADSAAAGPRDVMRLAITEFRLEANGAIHVYRAHEDEFLYCSRQGMDAEGNPTD